MITQLNPRNLAAAVRERNEHLMNVFIQADLRRRVGLDPRTSVVLYDANFVFNYALAAVPNERTLRKLFHETPVRYWSNGVQHTAAQSPSAFGSGVFCCVRVGLGPCSRERRRPHRRRAGPKVFQGRSGSPLRAT